ncbi:hypothetical protein Y032_0201g1722 [Ancylostoma ceylanicum]|uniref:Uncharacterized protein n=1 Tax=Ancylostoma ceylanicum TaxID=53326 RepID=A0A016SNB4_9BILA|nr:hypothetical protein Y032_0201g1722 [Ancylostoma ceylanicum]
MLILFLFLPTAFAAMCYQCASELALINWSRYGLPHAYGDSMIADDACLDDERLTGHVPCSAPCMTINITAVGGKHDGKVIGVIRDCQTYFRSPKSLPEGTTRMCRHSERVTLRNQRINMTFCYCHGAFCNGSGSAHLRRTALRRQPAARDPSLANQHYSMWFSLVFIAWAMS